MQSRLLFMALILPCPGSITMSAVIKFSSSEVIDRVGRVPGILILILLLFIAEVSFYSPGRDFACLDGSATIPFNQVNDDYCDCKDGTDEPGKYKQQTVFTHASFERDIENHFVFPLND